METRTQAEHITDLKMQVETLEREVSKWKLRAITDRVSALRTLEKSGVGFPAFALKGIREELSLFSYQELVREADDLSSFERMKEKELDAILTVDEGASEILAKGAE